MAKPKSKKETETPEVEPGQPEATSTVAAPAPGKPNTLIWVIVGVVAIAGVVVGYGFYNGSRTKSYATKIESIYNTSKAKWTADDFDIDKFDKVSEFLEKMKMVKEDVDSALNQISKLSGSSKTKNLENYAKDYYTKAKTYSESGILLGEYGESLRGFQEDFMKIGTAAITETTGLIDFYKEIKKSLDRWIEKWKKATPPPAFKNFNENFLTAAKEISKALDDAITALEVRDEKAFEVAMEDLARVAENMSTIESPSEEEMNETFVSESQKNELETLGNKIINEVNGLKGTTFAF